VPKEWAAAPDPALPMKLISVDEVLAAVAGVLAAA
jgi:hypothetical protein